ncbi:MAG: hypothetical protein JKY81_02625 [Colwellia sp.]|nr:hypothetical protein [Colwellia sp.]
MKILKATTLAFILCFPTLSAHATWSGNITLANDYLFNGISQTQGDMAAQAGITWSADNGVYLGSWVSNVDFDQQASFELDGYIGYYLTLSKSVSVDFGISQYTYHGSSTSSDLNFPETYLKWQLDNSQINFWYTWDYFGTGARHFIMMATHRIKISEHFSITVSIDKSRSLDQGQWLWQPEDKDYLHGQISGHYQFQQFDLSVALHGTDLDSSDLNGMGDTRVLFSISRSFGG